jgi:hypothetical protein
MQFSEMDSKERMVLVASLFLVLIVFASSAYMYLNPPIQVVEAKVFDTYQKNGITHVWTYGAGKIRLYGLYDIEIGETYRITYQSRSRNNAEIVLSVDKIS